MEKTKHDVETGSQEDPLLKNDLVHNLSWTSVNVTVKDRGTKEPKAILSGVDGCVKAGEMLAIMGPSGSGKSTLLNALVRRVSSSTKVDGSVLVNGQSLPLDAFRHLSSYVEQEDTLIGSLTVEETLDFAAQLALTSSFSKARRIDLVRSLIRWFGLVDQTHSLIGTPIRKGISGGQKRRVSVASSLITGPKILFLDEFTSGLDSVASYEAVSCVKNFAREHNLVVVASIHQPSTSTFQLFDKLLLLSGGKTCYYGAVAGVKEYFDGVGCPMPSLINPAEFILDAVNVDFAPDRDVAKQKLAQLHENWRTSSNAATAREEARRENLDSSDALGEIGYSRRTKLWIPMILLHRSWIKSYRDVVAYGVRIAMYTGLAILMGTVWLRLDTDQTAIQSFINAIFFGSAFLSFMAVAYVPSFLEDLSTFQKERANGLYGPTSFMVSNFLIGLPYLFLIDVLFSVISYWLINLRPTATAFFTWLLWLFLDLLAAESLVVLVSAVFPNFVISLALTAFANGLWMSVGGFLVTPSILNVFWRYVFHYIDYQAYVFQGMMVNEFSGRNYSCGDGCHCMYQSVLNNVCEIEGKAVLDVYQYAEGRTGKWVGILIGIIAGYRFLGWVVLSLRKH